MVQQSGDGGREAHGGKYAGAKEGVAAKGVEQYVFGAGDIRVYPGNVRKLLDGELTNWALLAFPDPF